MSETTHLACACGRVHLEVDRAPIVSTDAIATVAARPAPSCRLLPAAPPFVESNGGTRFVLYRKDRIRFLEGTEQLKEFRLAPGAKSRRVVATCCDTPVFLEFQNGRWLSLYGCLWPMARCRRSICGPMTSDLPDDVVLPGISRTAGGKRSRSLPSSSARGLRWDSKARK